MTIKAIIFDYGQVLTRPLILNIVLIAVHG